MTARMTVSTYVESHSFTDYLKNSHETPEVSISVSFVPGDMENALVDLDSAIADVKRQLSLMSTCGPVIIPAPPAQDEARKES